jgi:hypothetical protein
MFERFRIHPDRYGLGFVRWRVIRLGRFKSEDLSAAMSYNQKHFRA